MDAARVGITSRIVVSSAASSSPRSAGACKLLAGDRVERSLLRPRAGSCSGLGAGATTNCSAFKRSGSWGGPPRDTLRNESSPEPAPGWPPGPPRATVCGRRDFVQSHVMPTDLDLRGRLVADPVDAEVGGQYGAPVTHPIPSGKETRQMGIVRACPRLSRGGGGFASGQPVWDLLGSTFALVRDWGAGVIADGLSATHN